MEYCKTLSETVSVILLNYRNNIYKYCQLGSFVANPFVSIGPIYYEYGSVVITYDNNEAAVKAFNSLKGALFEEKNLLVMLLPNIQVCNATCHHVTC